MVTRHFFIVPGASRACADFLIQLAVSRFKVGIMVSPIKYELVFFWNLKNDFFRSGSGYENQKLTVPWTQKWQFLISDPFGCRGGRGAQGFFLSPSASLRTGLPKDELTFTQLGTATAPRSCFESLSTNGVPWDLFLVESCMGNLWACIRIKKAQANLSLWFGKIFFAFGNVQ